MTQAATQANLTSHTLSVEHIRISSSRSFAEVRQEPSPVPLDVDRRVVVDGADRLKDGAKVLLHQGPNSRTGVAAPPGGATHQPGQGARRHPQGNPGGS